MSEREFIFRLEVRDTRGRPEYPKIIMCREFATTEALQKEYRNLRDSYAKNKGHDHYAVEMQCIQIMKEDAIIRGLKGDHFRTNRDYVIYLLMCGVTDRKEFRERRLAQALGGIVRVGLCGYSELDRETVYITSKGRDYWKQVSIIGVDKI